MQNSINSMIVLDPNEIQHPMMNSNTTTSNVGQFQSHENHGNTYRDMNILFVPHISKEGIMVTADGIIEQSPAPYMTSLASETYTHNQTSMAQQLSEVDIVSELFPFVCGICSLKFNKIHEFYCHFKVHGFCKYSEKYFHVCENKIDEPCDSSSEDIKLYTCGVCGLPFPSVCTLHDHMVDLEKVARYSINVKTKTTERITYIKEENIPLSNNKLNVGEIVFHPESCVPIDTCNHNKFTDHVISEQLCDKNVPTRVDNSTSVDNYTQSDISKESRNIEISKLNPVETFIQDRQVAAVARKGLTDVDQSEVDTDTFPQVDGINSAPCVVSESPRANGKEIQTIDNNLNADVSSSIKSFNEPKSEPPSNCDTDSMHNIDKYNQQQTECVKRVHYTRQSKRREEYDHKNTSFKPQSENDISAITQPSNKSQSIFVSQDHADGGDDDYLIRERKFDDPKQERRRLLMIKYQRQYRQRKKLKAMALLNSKQTDVQSHEAAKGIEIKEKLSSQARNVVDMKVPCDVCGLLFKKRNLKRHTETHCDVKAYQCEICLKSFKTKNYLYAHKMHHIQEKDLICDYCGKAFNNGPNLRQHLKIHVGEKSLQCPICPKKFRSNYVLKDHIMRHSDVKPHMCQVCGRTFKVAQEVTRHMIVHSEERPHVCKTCLKGFKCRSNLVKHEKIHTKGEH